MSENINEKWISIEDTAYHLGVYALCFLTDDIKKSFFF